MAKAEATVEELVSMIERGELRLPEMQRRYVWRSTRVRDLLDTLYRGYPSGAILLWETDEAVPLQEFSVSQQKNPYQSTRLLLDGQQRLTSLSAVIRGEPVSVRGRKRPIDLLFNLEHPEELALVTEVDEDANDDEDLIEDENDSTEDELQRRFDKVHAPKQLTNAFFVVRGSSCPSRSCAFSDSLSAFARRSWKVKRCSRTLSLIALVISFLPGARETIERVAGPAIVSRFRAG